MDLQSSAKRQNFPLERSLQGKSLHFVTHLSVPPPIRSSYTVLDATAGSGTMSRNEIHHKRSRHKKKTVVDESHPTDLEGQNQNVLEAFVPLTSFALQGVESSRIPASGTQQYPHSHEVESKIVGESTDYAGFGECTVNSREVENSPLPPPSFAASPRSVGGVYLTSGKTQRNRGASTKASSPSSLSPTSKTELGTSWIPTFSPHSTTTAEETERQALSIGSSYQTEEGAEHLREPLVSCCVKADEFDQWERKIPRKHAFQRPLHVKQIVVGIVQIMALYFFWGAVVPGLALLYRERNNTDALLELVVLASLLFLTSVFFFSSWLIISLMDNADHGKNGGLVCVHCGHRTMVESKHCKACNKCVTGFDHHCKWLNMCIGSRNYKYFLVYMVSGISTMIIALVSGILFLAQWWNELKYFSLYYRIVPFFLVGLMAFGLPPLMKLLGFHIMLIWKGITTYAFILKKRQAKAK